MKVVLDWDGTVTETDVLNDVICTFGDELVYDRTEALLGDHDQLVQHLADVGLVLGALEQRDELARHHRHDGRNALDAELLGDQLVGVDVDLGEDDPAGVLLGQALQDRAELLARAAPLGPEVDHHRHLGRALHDLARSA